MASSLSVANFISSFLSKTPAPPKLAATQISTALPSSSPTRFQTLKSRNGLVPMVAHEERSSSISYSSPYAKARPYHVQIIVEDDEPDEVLVSKFMRDVARAGVFREVRRRMFHENKQERRKRKIREASRRNRRRRPFVRYPENDEATAKAGKDDNSDDEDNWDLPDGEDLLD